MPQQLARANNMFLANVLVQAGGTLKSGMESFILLTFSTLNNQTDPYLQL